ncbi:hypothetical protein K450DRAFT_255179 [Umbelopsis ramanniana AG]|uniref:Uncharacterized protein n=1 Tax=Umbelopsis ramanniana AG TaxID=1314678 RepID=A0AAD5HA83_UMBRA|nr:uncharacterized protein K450DRAFT_255179 [Umbelopsis ramanniana AG]KAI8576825.1 hypothetical protein K450DRAFT_255179 [Umbelopsis ramanniana AG]
MYISSSVNVWLARSIDNVVFPLALHFLVLLRYFPPPTQFTHLTMTLSPLTMLSFLLLLDLSHLICIKHLKKIGM